LHAYYKVFLSLTEIVQHYNGHIGHSCVTTLYAAGHYLLSRRAKSACAIREILIAIWIEWY